jgi:putative acetyltransferase
MTAKAVEIREERPDDVGAIRALNLAAFGRPQEGALIDALRTNGAISLSLVAAVEGRLVGQALYSPVSISLNGEEAVGAGLGPNGGNPRAPAQRHRR